ncbi:MAG: DUF4394 domain-containing protein [Pyrinomonadaceae bacterium]
MSINWNQKLTLIIASVLLFVGAASASVKSPDNIWETAARGMTSQLNIDAAAMPTVYETFRLNKPALQALLARAPEEFSRGTQVILSLPMPDGSYQRFAIEHSLVVERGLLKNYPELGATYRGYGIDDPTAFVRFDFLPSGFHSMILSPNGTVIVDPLAQNDTDNYVSYFKRDKPRTGGFECEVKDDDAFDPVTTIKDFDATGLFPAVARPQSAPEVTSGTQLRVYRLALAANNEYCVAVGGNTVAGCLAAEVLIMNRVNGVYEKDLALRMVIIANNNLITYAGDNLTCPVPGGSSPCTSANDPYGNDTSALSQNTPNLNTVIGVANYDIGHVFTTGSGGVAQLGVPCGGSKGAGTTGLPNPVGDPFAIDYVAHELGHQWGANHTYNSLAGGCNGQRSAGSAYEVGSGITIMAYAGLCAPQDLANNSIDTFHVKSLEVIVAYSQTGQGNQCPVTTASGNTPPTVTGPGNFNIPRLTPFALTAIATDPDAGDSITYDWQEYDLGAAPTTTLNSDQDGQPRPIFRPFLPTTGGTRTFPRLIHILNSANVPPTSTGGFLTGEILPSITRTMTFQVVARDNHPGTGGINTATSTLNVDAASGPFNVTAPNTAVSFVGNTFQNVTWDVANTAAAPVSAANVRISLSTDGGNTFPTVLAASTANDGNESVLIPNTPSTTARVKVEAVGNIFFDISNTNFTITAGGTGTPTPTATFTGSPTPTNTATPTATATPIPCGSWVAGPAQPPGRYTLQGVLASDNKMYIAGGSSADNPPVLTNKFTRYNATTNAWEDQAPLPVAIGQGAMGAWSGKVYVAGGFLGGTAVTNALRIYDIATNTWTSGANIPTPGAGLEAAAGAVVNGKFYVMGGDDFNVGLNSTYIYDIATNTWTTGANVPDQRTNTYGTAFNGLIYVYGGAVGGTFAANDNLLRYDPVANSWTNLGSAGTTGRGNYGAVSPFGTGQLLITSGANTGFVAVNTTRIFTISSGTFAAGPNMLSARAAHAQATLPDGRVLVADGLDTAGTTTSGVEILAPCGTGTPTNTPTNTATGTITPTFTATFTATGSATVTNTPTATATSTPGGSGEVIYGMTVAALSSGATGADGVALVRFNSTTPGTVTTIGPFTNLTATHAMRSIDFRPATGQLWGLSTNPAGSAAQLYTINLATAACTPVGPGFALGTNAFTFIEMDFNPVADRIRIVTAGGGTVGNNNFRANPNDGTLVQQDTALAFDASSPRVGATNFNIIGGAYSNNFAGATQTTLYGWDFFDDALITIGGLNGTPSPNGGLMFTVNTPAAFLTFNAVLGMDISGASGTMFVAHADANAGTTPNFYTRNVTTGAETLVGSFPAGVNVGDVTVLIQGGTPTPTATSTSTPISPTPTFTATATATGSPSATPQGTFANSTAICTTLGSAGAPYPSNIVVAGGPNQIDGIIVRLINVFHQLPDNMDFLLVGPNGARFILMADAGGSQPLNSPGVTLTFSDAAGAVLPDSGALTTGTFEPTSWEPGQTSFPAPAPPVPYNEPGSTIGGTGTQTLAGNFPRFSNANGTWSLYMRDDGGLFESPTNITGCVNGGWQIQFVPTTSAPASIAGRVATANGQGIRNAQIVVTGNSLAEPIVVTTGSFGYYSIDGLATGETYVVTVNSRRYTFSTPSRVISLVDNVADADFIADPQE